MNQSPKKLSNLTDDELEVYFAKKAYKLTDEEIKTCNFLFWLIYYIEKRLGEILIYPIKKHIEANDGSIEEALDILMDELYLNSKINAFGKSLPEAKNLHNYLRKINDLRNSISHGRIKALKYSGSSISERETKENMISDLFKFIEETRGLILKAKR